MKFKVRAILHPVCNKRHDWLILGGRKKEPISARLQTVFGWRSKPEEEGLAKVRSSPFLSDFITPERWFSYFISTFVNIFLKTRCGRGPRVFTFCFPLLCFEFIGHWMGWCCKMVLHVLVCYLRLLDIPMRALAVLQRPDFPVDRGKDCVWRRNYVL